jgi:hypothetical protein
MLSPAANRLLHEPNRIKLLGLEVREELEVGEELTSCTISRISRWMYVVIFI